LIGGKWGHLEASGVQPRQVGSSRGKWGQVEASGVQAEASGSSWRQEGSSGVKWGQLEAGVGNWRQVEAIGGKWVHSDASRGVSWACGVFWRQLEVRRGHCCSCSRWGMGARDGVEGGSKEKQEVGPGEEEKLEEKRIQRFLGEH